MSRQLHAHSLYDIIDQVITDAVDRGIGHLQTQDERLDGRRIEIAGRSVLNLGSASYMSLEQHPALKAGVLDAVERFGTQFASSRAYVSLGAYEQLEALLGQILGRSVVVTPSTTLGHISAIPVLVGDRDAVVLDHQVHNSVQTAIQLLRARGVPITMIRHNRMDQLESEIQRLKAKHERVWYFADGVYSMHGDGTPVPTLAALHERYPQFWSYVDDAHGFGWTGTHGCGWVSRQGPLPPQVVLAVSLNKSFSAAGGALAFDDPALARRVRTCGGPLIFSGPIQPPMLGAAIASARLHLSPAIDALQGELADAIAYANEGMAARGLPQLQANDTPLFFVPAGLPRRVYEISGRLLADGVYINQGCFPAVPMSQGGLRFHVHRGLDRSDIDALLDRMVEHYTDVLREDGVTPQELARAFREPALAQLKLDRPAPTRRRSSLRLLHTTRIAEIPAVTWDALFAGQGPMSHAALSALEPALASGPEGTSTAAMHYVCIYDQSGTPVLATFYGVTRVKADMLASEEISKKVEIERQEDPDFLVSPGVVMGSPISLGTHLQIDRDHPAWREALGQLVQQMQQTKREVGATQILLRDFPRGEDDPLRERLLELGFVEIALPDMMTIERIEWEDREGLLAALPGRYRHDLRREFLPSMDGLRVDDTPTDDPAVIDACYALYRQVHARGLRMNVFPLPRAVFEAMFACPEFDVVRLYEPQERDPARPAAVLVSHQRDRRCTALLVGFCRAHVASHNVYKVALLHMVERARARGATSLNLAYTAELVKKKLGARPRPTAAFVMLDDTYAASVLETL